MILKVQTAEGWKYFQNVENPAVFTSLYLTEADCQLDGGPIEYKAMHKTGDGKEMPFLPPYQLYVMETMAGNDCQAVAWCSGQHGCESVVFSGKAYLLTDSGETIDTI
jgi:hypothetical protein